jgi:hypothetical protein
VNYGSVAIGVAAIAYGCFTFYARAKMPTKFSKLEAMKRMFGPRAGLAVHTIAYSLLPIAVGMLAIFRGMEGQSFFGR